MSDRVTVYSKVDIKSLAIIAKFLAQEGVPPKGQSDLVNQGIKVLADHLIRTDITTPVSSKRHAVEELKELGITWDRGSRGRKDIQKNLGGKPSTDVAKKAPRTEEGGLDLEQLQREAEEVHREVGNQGGGTDGEVAPPDPSQS